MSYLLLDSKFTKCDIYNFLLCKILHAGRGGYPLSCPWSCVGVPPSCSWFCPEGYSLVLSVGYPFPQPIPGLGGNPFFCPWTRPGQDQVIPPNRTWGRSSNGTSLDRETSVKTLHSRILRNVGDNKHKNQRNGWHVTTDAQKVKYTASKFAN